MSNTENYYYFFCHAEPWRSISQFVQMFYVRACREILHYVQNDIVNE